jgi:hypothetical protein
MTRLGLVMRLFRLLAPPHIFPTNLQSRKQTSAPDKSCLMRESPQ